jgi:hypothetical protein
LRFEEIYMTPNLSCNVTLHMSFYSLVCLYKDCNFLWLYLAIDVVNTAR